MMVENTLQTLYKLYTNIPTSCCTIEMTLLVTLLVGSHNVWYCAVWTLHNLPSCTILRERARERESERERERHMRENCTTTGREMEH